MASNKKYWKSVDELNGENSVLNTLKQNEFVREIPIDEFLGDGENLKKTSTTRRDFLKYVGFSTIAASLVACEGPVNKTIPYVMQPEQIRPGVADYYATAIADGYDFASIVVKTREGRPILIQNNKDAVNGKANARVHASVLSLYDNMRAKNPTKKGGAELSWSELDAEIKYAMDKANSEEKQIALLTHTLASPSSYKLIDVLKEKYKTLNFVEYDAISEEATLKAFMRKYDVWGMPDYDFKKADLIVSFDADFVSDWQGGGYEEDYVAGRIPKNGKMSKHIQLEANMSLTGANADVRIPLKPSQLKIAIAKFYAYIIGTRLEGKLPANVDEQLKNIAYQVRKAGSKAVVVTGIQDENAQLLALEINEFLQSEAYNPHKIVNTRKGDSQKVNALIDDMNNGNVGVLIIANVNPMYTLANREKFATGLKKVQTSVTLTMRADETAILTDFIAPSHHYLEAWGDVEIKQGDYALMQPTIRPLFNTRQLQDALIAWGGIGGTYYEFIRNNWENNLLDGKAWNKVLHDGYFKSEKEFTNAPKEIINIMSSVRELYETNQGAYELQLYAKVGMGDGQQANNPWLQEFPDPITRTTWDNYLTMSRADAEELGFKNWHVADGAMDGNYANINVGGVSMTVPVLIQPGQAKGSFGYAFGYGRKEGMKKEMQVGGNAYSLYSDFKNVQRVYIEKAEGTHEFACVQLHNTLMGRGDIIKETTLHDYNTQSPEKWNPKPEVSLNHNPVKAQSVTLWTEYDQTIGHHFNLSVDLNACTGCGACVIACHAENNVPVVGKEEVRKSRDMHWLRIDRYYSSQPTFLEDLEAKEKAEGLTGVVKMYKDFEHPADNPQVSFQPVMCQQCNNASCETVCPVGATSHGAQGQNHMAYNRCVGTRYCANNCPYNVRRFNWFLYHDNDEFDFHMNDDLGRMVLNPDVTVRARGVMEKCSFCIQDTQAVILRAKNEGRKVRTDEFLMACACSAACGTGAMVFGDVNDKNSQISKVASDDRAYHLLEHIGLRPNVLYQVKVRNTD